mmetsp:Transcript_34969/g.81830  ORF Transcript_34969/g.81830 Transcript_34969/m.81830 type:complete len:301 (-) Transcript_34969:157-1059(-)
MGKSGGGKKASGGAKGPSSAWLWSGAALVVAFAGWASFQKVPVAKTSTDNSDVDMDDLEDDDGLGGRFDSIREALFSADGGSLFSAENMKGASGKSRFADATYWDERYSKAKKDYDWYGTWNGDSPVTIKSYVEPYMPAGAVAILNAGCGNSRLPSELLSDGYDNITNIDISQTAISKMQAKFAGTKGLAFLQMDVTAMTFPSNSFDVVLEKGTLDAMYTGASAVVKEAVAEFYRVLRPGGIFVSMSFGLPQSRKDLNKTGGTKGPPREVEDNAWTSFHTIRVDRKEVTAQAFYLYIMQK